MADTKGSALTALTGANSAAGDQFLIIDKSDTAQGAGGTLKNMTRDEAKNALLSTNLVYYSVYQEGANYVARNHLSGAVEYFGTVQSAAIQTAVDGLTVGRTWREKISLFGEFDNILTSIDLSEGYVTLDLEGAILTAGASYGSATAMFAASGATGIRVIGGTVDGAEVGSYPLISFSASSDLHVSGVSLLNAATHGVSITSSSNFLVERNYIDNHGDDGVSCADRSFGGVIALNEFAGGRDVTGAGGSANVEIEDGSHHIIVANNQLTESADVCIGVQVIQDAATHEAPHHILIDGNVINGKSNGVNTASASAVNWGITSIVEALADSSTNYIGDNQYTITTSSAHPFPVSAGEPLVPFMIRLEGVATADYNQVFRVTAVPSTTTIEFRAENALGASGSVASAAVRSPCYKVKCTNNIVTSSADIGFRQANVVGCSMVGNESSYANAGSSGGGGFFINTAYGGTYSDNGSDFDLKGFIVQLCERLAFTNNTVHKSEQTGIDWDGCIDVAFKGNSVIDCGNLRATRFAVQQSGTTASSGCSFSGNTLKDTRSTKIMRCMDISSGSTGLIVEDNILEGLTSGGKLITNNGTDTVFKNNKGYLSENSGVATGISTGGAIAHGIANNTGGTLVPHVTAMTAGVTDLTVAVDATNITVTFGGGGSASFAWSVESV